MSQPDIHAIFRERLREARTAMGLSQAGLGREIGLPDETASTRINRYERGTSKPDLQIIEEMAAVLGVSAAYLIAPDERTAKLLLAFSNLTAGKQEKVLALAESLSGGTPEPKSRAGRKASK